MSQVPAMTTEGNATRARRDAETGRAIGRMLKNPGRQLPTANSQPPSATNRSRLPPFGDWSRSLRVDPRFFRRWNRLAPARLRWRDAYLELLPAAAAEDADRNGVADWCVREHAEELAGVVD